MKETNENSNILFLFIFAMLLVSSFLKIHIKIRTTMLGYELGRLKNQEFVLLKKRSSLTMDLAQLTTKTTLSSILEEH